MTDLPIMFTDPLVLSVYRGDKTETRRNAWGKAKTLVPIPTKWQRLKTGDRLFVQESWSLLDAGNGLRGGAWCKIRYGADGKEAQFHLSANEKLPKPSVVGNKMFMPRWMSRGTLVLTRDAKIERVQDISAPGAIAEGVVYETADPGFYYVPGFLPHSITAVGIEERDPTPHEVRCFGKLWRHINGNASWHDNPEVVPLAFQAHLCNIDDMPEARAA